MMENRVETGVLERLFGVRKPIIGMIHVQPLPGSPRGRNCDLEAVYQHAIDEAKRLEDGGVDGLLLENAGDIPFLKPDDIGFETVAAMTVIGDRIRRATRLPFGFNIVANAAKASLACARMSGGSFVRVNQWANAYVANEGLKEGDAARVLRYRAAIRADDVAIFADSHVKHGAHAIVADREVSELTRDVEFFDADAVIATGRRTGDPADPDELATIVGATRLPVLVGSGVTPDNVGAILQQARGVIIGSSLKQDGVWWRPVERARVEAFMAIVAGLDRQ